MDPSLHERELDEMLARAAGLARELDDEEGTEKDAAVSPHAPTGPARNVQPGAAATVEIELDQLDELLEQTAAQLEDSDEDAAEDLKAKTRAQPGSDPGSAESEPTAEAIPDFMKEFMAEEPAGGGQGDSEPQPPESPPPDAEAAAPQPDAPILAATPPRAGVTSGRPGVVGTGMLGVVKSQDQEGPAAVSRALQKADPLRKLLRMVWHLRTKLPSLRGLRRRAPNLPSSLTRLPPAAMIACRHGVALLEWMDRPLQKAGPRVRRIVGWVAVATLTTALLVHLVSFF